MLQDKEKTDIYLIQDAEDKKFVALITDGTAIDAINSYFFNESIIDIDHNITDRKSMIHDVKEYESKRRANIPINPFLTSAAVAAVDYADDADDADNDADNTEVMIVTSPPSNRLKPLSSPSDEYDDYTPSTPPPPPLTVTITTTPIPVVSAVDNTSKSMDSRSKEVNKAKKRDERVVERRTDVYYETKSDFEAHTSIKSNSNGNRTTVYPQNMVSSFGKDPQPSPVVDDDVTSSGKYIFSTMIMKGEQGMGLDLGKTKLTWDQGRSLVLRFKDFPNGEVNPALRCNPAIHIGDVIIAVNDVPCETLSDTVKVIRGLSIGNVKLTLERTV